MIWAKGIEKDKDKDNDKDGDIDKANDKGKPIWRKKLKDKTR